MARKSMTPIVLAGLAAAAYYAYSKMSPEQKEQMFGTIKKTGKDLLGKLWPSSTEQVNKDTNSEVG
ncbi:MAG: hypothetical protein JNK79_12400 [Chitinophagaceae bacterium]|nr:hypothetical protein [Chitinophagaceae bacterium]